MAQTYQRSGKKVRRKNPAAVISMAICQGRRQLQKAVKPPTLNLYAMQCSSGPVFRDLVKQAEVVATSHGGFQDGMTLSPCSCSLSGLLILRVYESDRIVTICQMAASTKIGPILGKAAFSS